jgi:uncharacterized protein YndB with AHSA1/START domain
MSIRLGSNVVLMRARYADDAQRGVPHCNWDVGQSNKRLTLSWRAHWDAAVAKDPPSRVTYELSSVGAHVTKLGVVHDQFEGETATYKGSVEGWPLMLSSLKTLLESGKTLPVK